MQNFKVLSLIQKLYSIFGYLDTAFFRRIVFGDGSGKTIFWDDFFKFSFTLTFHSHFVFEPFECFLTKLFWLSFPLFTALTEMVDFRKCFCLKIMLSEEEVNIGEDTFQGELVFCSEVPIVTNFTHFCTIVSWVSELIGINSLLRTLTCMNILWFLVA